MESILIIHEEEFDSKEELLTYIAEELDFPDYFGGNLDALMDCLTDIDEPVNIAFDPVPSDYSELWYHRVWRVLKDAAEENECVRLYGAVETE